MDRTNGPKSKTVDVLPVGNNRNGYIVQRARSVHVEAPINGFHVPSETRPRPLSSQASLYYV